jgi:hypothetical protein
MGSCSECGASKGAKPSFLESQVRRRRARSYSSSGGEWWDLLEAEYGPLAALMVILGVVGVIVSLLVLLL